MRSVRLFEGLDLIKVLFFICKKFTRLQICLQATAAEEGQPNISKNNGGNL